MKNFHSFLIVHFKEDDKIKFQFDRCTLIFKKKSNIFWVFLFCFSNYNFDVGKKCPTAEVEVQLRAQRLVNHGRWIVEKCSE